VTSGVYAIVNPSGDRLYIGSSINIEARWVGHLYVLNSPTRRPNEMTQAWRAAQGQGFVFAVLETVEPEDAPLEQAEQRWMDQFGDSLYNMRRRARRARPDTITLFRRGKLPPDETERLLTSQYDLIHGRRRRTHQEAAS
jgi:group I intron endonuclease